MTTEERKIYRLENIEDIVGLARKRISKGDIIQFNNCEQEIAVVANRDSIVTYFQNGFEEKLERTEYNLKTGRISCSGNIRPGDGNFDKYKSMLEEAGLWHEAKLGVVV